MSNEELEECIDIIAKALSESNLNNYTKLEMMINLKLFMENYEENIRILRNVNYEKEKKIQM